MANPKRYRIVIRGRLSYRFADAFDGMTLELDGGETVLRGDVEDQSALYGLLDRIRDFGLELVSVDSEARP